ncbi:hypothetical protein BJ508DRAFT_417424, partial [Ascobolus immersus RN42]
MHLSFITLLYLLPLASALKLHYPPPRSTTTYFFENRKLDPADFPLPCNGTTPSENRTLWPSDGRGTISFTTEDVDPVGSVTYVKLSKNNANPQREADAEGNISDDFGIILKNSMVMYGSGEFCWRPLDVLSQSTAAQGDWGRNGTLATLLVFQGPNWDDEDEGSKNWGTYACADVILVDNAPEGPECRNDTDIEVVAYPGVNGTGKGNDMPEWLVEERERAKNGTREETDKDGKDDGQNDGKDG